MRQRHTCAGYFGYAFSKKTVNSKVSNSFASCAMERWRVKEYESAIGTGILEQMPSGVNTGWLAGGTEGIDSATGGQSPLESGLRHARGKEVIKRSNPRSTCEACWGAG